MTVSTPRTMPMASRHFGLDWLRVAAFVLLIFYHIGMVFAPGTWMIKSPHVIEAVAWPMVLIQPWRMPLLFAVSGYASYALLSKSPSISGFAWLRSRRLLLPLLFGVLFIVAPQWWIKLSIDQGYAQGYAHFWWHDWLSFDSEHGTFLPDTGHLWFIAYLWTYTMLAALLCWLANDAARSAAARCAAWLNQHGRLFWVPILPLLILRLGLLFTVPEHHGLLHDWVSDATFLPPFLLGFGLAAYPGWWEQIRVVRREAACLALISGIAVLAIEVLVPDGIVPRGHVVQALQRDMALVMAWSMVFVLMGLADRVANVDHRWRLPLCEAVFPFYIAHQTIIVGVAWLLLRAGVGPLASFVTLVAATFAGCWAFYRLALLSGPLREWLGLAPGKAQPITRPTTEQVTISA